MSPGTVPGKTDISAFYVASARYQKGDAKLRFWLSKRDGSWRVDLFDIESTDLINNLAGSKS